MESKEMKNNILYQERIFHSTLASLLIVEKYCYPIGNVSQPRFSPTSQLSAMDGNSFVPSGLVVAYG